MNINKDSNNNNRHTTKFLAIESRKIDNLINEIGSTKENNKIEE